VHDKSCERLPVISLPDKLGSLFKRSDRSQPQANLGVGSLSWLPPAKCVHIRAVVGLAIGIPGLASTTTGDDAPMLQERSKNPPESALAGT